MENLKSKPYIDMTLSVLEAFGIEIEREGYRRFKIRGRQAYHSCIFPVEGDWSGASCFLVAGALAGKVKITNLNINSTQADRQILEVLRQVGAEVLVEPGEKWDSVTVSHKELRPFECEATDSPDLFPALVALASGCTGTSRIRGLIDWYTKRVIVSRVYRKNLPKWAFESKSTMIRCWLPEE